LGEIIGIMQPTYLPWLGFFELMQGCDQFVFLDDVQFIKKDWLQRNRIKVNENFLWLTVPIITKGRRFQKIVDSEINNQINWASKHLKSIKFYYQKAQYFDKYFPFLEEIYKKRWTKLIDLNIALISFLCEQLKIKTPYAYSSNLTGIREERNDRIIDICKSFDCKKMYDAEGARSIIDSEKINEAGISIIFQKYDHPHYNQLHGKFISHLSVIDLLFNEGNNSLDIIRQGA